MAAYAEGMNILRNANIGSQKNASVDAETTPLREPEYYQYDFDLINGVIESFKRVACHQRGPPADYRPFGDLTLMPAARNALRASPTR